MQGLGEGVSTDQVGEFFKQIGIIKVSKKCHTEDFIIINILIKIHALHCVYCSKHYLNPVMHVLPHVYRPLLSVLFRFLLL